MDIPEDHPHPLLEAIMVEMLRRHPAPVTGTEMIRLFDATSGRVFRCLYGLRDHGLVERTTPSRRGTETVPYRYTKAGLTLAQRPLIRCRWYRFHHSGWSYLHRSLVVVLAAGLRAHPEPFTSLNAVIEEGPFALSHQALRSETATLRKDRILTAQPLEQGDPLQLSTRARLGHNLTEEGLQLARLCTDGLELRHFYSTGGGRGPLRQGAGPNVTVR